MQLIRVLISLVIPCVAFAAVASPLGPYNISDVTVSGISSGGYMAVQMHVAFSSLINGAAIFAAGPFYCAESTATYALHKCMQTDLGKPQVEKLVTLTWDDAALLYIDNPLYLKNDRVYLFSGNGDSVVDEVVVRSLQKYYTSFIEETNIVADYDFDAEHCMPTLNYGERCTSLSSPYLGKCGFDGAGIALNAILGDLKTGGVAVEANLQTFNQKPYIYRSLSSIGDTGYIYVPTACRSGASCRLHVSFHGCEQTLENIGNQYAAHSGYNDWAEANNIIVLYPYVTPSKLTPLNPNGCWDWWAYSGVDYGVKTGVQMQFVKSLIDTISGKK